MEKWILHLFLRWRGVTIGSVSDLWPRDWGFNSWPGTAAQWPWTSSIIWYCPKGTGSDAPQAGKKVMAAKLPGQSDCLTRSSALAKYARPPVWNNLYLLCQMNSIRVGPGIWISKSATGIRHDFWQYLALPRLCISHQIRELLISSISNKINVTIFVYDFLEAGWKLPNSKWHKP